MFAGVTADTVALKSDRAFVSQLLEGFEPEPVAEETARQLFALARTLDGETGLRKAPPSSVLRLYCIEDLEPEQIARRLGRSKSLVYSRLGLLSRKLGREPGELRQFSTHLERIEESLSDSRAARIYHG